MQRIAWRQQAPDWDPQRLVFLDESSGARKPAAGSPKGSAGGRWQTGLNTKMAPRYGRAPRAERCVQKVPHGHWQTWTFIAALRHDRVAAPWLLDGPMDRAAFLTYLEHCLAPTLQPGDLVIVDNLSSHKGPAVAAAVERCGAQLLHLPPYSPDFHPIELAFAKLKAHLRTAAARTFAALVKKLKAALHTFLPSHCANFFAHCHYAAT